MVHIHKTNKRILTYSALAILVAVYSVMATHDLFTDWDYPDWKGVESRLNDWPVEMYKFDVHLRYALLKASVIVFDNVKVIPFLLSVSLILMTFVFARHISKSSIGALLAASLVTTNNLFAFFDASAAYDNSWVLFYLMSLYFVEKRWFLSPMFFIMSIFCKPITVLYLPASIFWVYYSTIPQKRKLLIIYGFMTGTLFGVSMLTDYKLHETFQVSIDGMISGLGDWAGYFAQTDYWMVFLVPVSIILLVIFYKKNPYSLRMAVCQCTIIFSGVLVEGFTRMYNEPYRYVPLVIFFAISISLFTRYKALKETKAVKEYGVAS